jgi:hypothetical protein
MVQRPSPPPAIELLPTTFAVGKHAVKVARSPQGRWSAAVDDRPPVPSTYETQVDAWEAGVREADRLDRAGT